MGFRESFDRNEWQTLQFAPFWVYQLVANADRDIDESESDKIVDEIAKAAECESPLASEVLKSVSTNYFPVAERYAFDERRSFDGLKDVAGLLAGKVSPPAAEGFREVLLGIGRNVAESSGGDSGDSATADSEAAMIEKIAATLQGSE